MPNAAGTKTRRKRNSPQKGLLFPENPCGGRAWPSWAGVPECSWSRTALARRASRLLTAHDPASSLRSISQERQPESLALNGHILTQAGRWKETMLLRKHSPACHWSPLHEGNNPCPALVATGQALPQGWEWGEGSTGGWGVRGNSAEQSCGRGTGTGPAPIFSPFPKEVQCKGACSPWEPPSLGGGPAASTGAVRAGIAVPSLARSPHTSPWYTLAPGDRPRSSSEPVSLARAPVP